MTNQEKKAFETFIASELLKSEKSDENVDREFEATGMEKEILDGVEPDFLKKVIAGEKKVRTQPIITPKFETTSAQEPVLYRAEELSGEDADKLDENERKLIERKRNEKRSDDSN